MFHFIGIKGSGMSSLAQVMHTLGYIVQGSDVAKEFFTEIGLREKNIPYFVYNKENIKENMQIIVGNSIKEDNEELIKAKQLNLKIFSYQEMIGKLAKKYKSVAVSGCHGKTTTTSMLAHTLNSLIGCNYLIGDGTGYANKKNDYFVFEACEYKRHFLSYFPKYIIITNIELDHIDYYKDLNDIKIAFKDFAIHAEKHVIAWGDDENIRSLNINKVAFYGLKDNNLVVAKNIKFNSENTEFDVYITNKFYHHFKLPVFGEHLLLNSLAVITLLYLEGFDHEKIANHLVTSPGARRRFAITTIKDTIIIDDYAHHPTEIKATIKAAKQKYPHKKIIAIFQPHTFSRTKIFVEEFAKALDIADKAYVLDIHPAREKQEDFPDVSSFLIINKLKNGHHLNSPSELLEYKGNLFLFMSANDLKELEDDFIKRL